MSFNGFCKLFILVPLLIGCVRLVHWMCFTAAMWDLINIPFPLVCLEETRCLVASVHIGNNQGRAERWASYFINSRKNLRVWGGGEMENERRLHCARLFATNTLPVFCTSSACDAHEQREHGGVWGWIDWPHCASLYRSKNGFLRMLCNCLCGT